MIPSRYALQLNSEWWVATGPSLSVQIYTLKRLSRILGLAWRGGGVNAILDKFLVLSEIGVIGSDDESNADPRRYVQGLVP